MAYEFRLPDIGEGLTEADVVEWHVAVGDVVTENQVLCELETAKAVVDMPSPAAGTVLHLGAGEGETIAVGDVLVVVGEPGEKWAPTADPGDAGRPATQNTPTRPGDASGPKAMPVVRRLAGELGVDLAAVPGTGPGGSITREDVETAARSGPGAGEHEVVRLSSTRRAIAKHMERSWREIPHVTTFDEVDATALLAARDALSTATGQPAPLEALVIGAVLPALVQFPEFNATLDGEQLILKRHYDIGFAVDTPEGLVVPVVADADKLEPGELASRVADLASRAVTRKLALDDLSGATFTVSNIGALGGGHGTPIIPYGTTSILSFGRAVGAPIVTQGTIGVAPLMPLSLSYDHRVIDGGLGRRFVAAVIANLTTGSPV